ncbi:MAG: phosphoribosylanthranilate isomerase [Phycisphaeraceae bacterium]|nr:phosphoribosylanthranilate isomerase [Phycisphaeraceae bacterium]
MGRTWVKICGVRDPDMARAAVAAGADAVGLVFVEKSPRHVTMAEAIEVVRAVMEKSPTATELVGLFVDAEIQYVRQTAEELKLSAVQLHGQEDVAYARSLGPLRVFKALAFGPDLAAKMKVWRECPNLGGLLIDTPPPDGAKAMGLPGGSGRAFDWEELRKVLDGGAGAGLRVILAGGLTPENVAEAVRVVKPWGVDVSSGVESRRGIKDAGLIRAFVAGARAGDTKTS